MLKKKEPRGEEAAGLRGWKASTVHSCVNYTSSRQNGQEDALAAAMVRMLMAWWRTHRADRYVALSDLEPKARAAALRHTTPRRGLDGEAYVDTRELSAGGDE